MQNREELSKRHKLSSYYIFTYKIYNISAIILLHTISDKSVCGGGLKCKFTCYVQIYNVTNFIIKNYLNLLSPRFIDRVRHTKYAQQRVTYNNYLHFPIKCI